MRTFRRSRRQAATESLSSLGLVEEGTAVKVEVKVTEKEKERLQLVEARPPLSEILNLHDFEVRRHLRSSTRFHLTIVQGYCKTYDG